MPGKDGLALLAEVRDIGIATPVIMISGQATIDMAVRATRLGAVDFLEKPVSTDKLLLTVENALRADAAGGGEPRSCGAAWAATSIVLEERGDAARDGAGRSRRRQRVARLHPRRDRHRQGAGRAGHPRAQPAPRAAVRHRELRGGARPS